MPNYLAGGGNVFAVNDGFIVMLRNNIVQKFFKQTIGLLGF
ncbi:hypothetical protein [Neisseria yangbaofengii]|nr:hypothetical protein [Neisseria yangbaofengii]